MILGARTSWGLENDCQAEYESEPEDIYVRGVCECMSELEGIYI